MAHKVKRMNFITRDYVCSNRDKIFLFGDNEQRKGMLGQARECRGEPNAIGVPTKRYPGKSADAFWSDDEFPRNKALIDEALALIPEDAEVVIPSAGLGTGLAHMDEFAPKTYAYLCHKLMELEG